MDNKDSRNNMSEQNQKTNSLITTNTESLFLGDSYGLFVFKKTEKIVTAIYLLTSLMSDSEPMKGKLRSIATEMLSDALAMSERVWGEEALQKNLIAGLCEMNSLFGVAETAKMISRMNYEIITAELKKLSDFLVTSSSNYSSAKIAFESSLFDGDYSYTPDHSYQETLIPTQEQILTTPVYKGQEDKKDIKKEEIVQKKVPVKNVTEEKTVKDKNDRQETIISALKGGAKLTIKDFAKYIKNCSDKTIQRELVLLVSKGVLKKEGERRWSKYFLA